MAAAIRISQYRTPGGAWTAYPFPLEFETREAAEYYARQNAPVEFLIGFGDTGGRETELNTGRSSASYRPPVFNPPPTLTVPRLGFGGLPAVPGTAPEANPPRFTAPGSEVRSTVRQEVVNILAGTSTPPRLTVSTPAAASAPTQNPPRSRAPEGPRILSRTDISAPEPNPPRLYSPLEGTFPLPGDTVSTGAAPNPPAIPRVREYFPAATAAETNPPRFTAPDLVSTVRDEVVKLQTPLSIPRATVTTPTPAIVPPPRAAAPPAPDPVPILSDARSDWDLARELWGEWWTKPGIWDQVRARFGGQLPENPDSRTPHGGTPPDNPTDDGTDPDIPMPDTTDTPTDSATDTGSRIDSLLNSLGSALTTVGALVDAFNPRASTAPPKTAAPEKPKANTSFVDSQPWYVWGGLGLLLLLLFGQKKR